MQNRDVSIMRIQHIRAESEGGQPERSLVFKIRS